MKTVHSLQGSEKQLRWKKFTALASAVLVVLGIVTLAFPVAILGAILLYTSLYRKTFAVDERGVTILYNMVFKTNRALHPFTAFSHLLIDNSDPQASRLGFVKNGVTNYGYFRPQDADAVKTAAKKQNPSIQIQSLNLRSRFN